MLEAFKYCLLDTHFWECMGTVVAITTAFYWLIEGIMYVKK
jgi:hypothetical protein